MGIQVIDGSKSWFKHNVPLTQAKIMLFILQGKAVVMTDRVQEEVSECSFSIWQLADIKTIEFNRVKAVIAWNTGFKINVSADKLVINELCHAVLRDVFFAHKRSSVHQEATISFICHQLADINSKQEQTAFSHKRNDKLSRVLLFMAQHLDEPLTLADLAKYCSCSKPYLVKIFKANKLQSPMKELSRRRVLRAQELLQNSALTITQIAKAVGYNGQATFTHFFKRNCKMSPREFRENHRWLL